MLYDSDKGNPLQWLPQPDKEDADCTILELWARYADDIARFRNFRSSAATIRNYTTTLAVIQEALSQKPAAKMMPYDCWDAAVSVDAYSVQGGWKPYSKSTLRTRLTIMTDIYMFAESRAICCNPLHRPPWRLLYAKNNEDFTCSANDLRHQLQKMAATNPVRRSLTRSQEQQLWGMIKENYTTDGRWIGLAIYLFAGARPAEGRGVKYGDIHGFDSVPERSYLILSGTADASGKTRKRMKNKYSHRRLPLAYELQHLLNKRAEQIRQVTGESDIDSYPIICMGNEFARPCTATEMAIFAGRVLETIMEADSLDAAALELYSGTVSVSDTDADAAAAEQSVTTYILRRNYCTKLYAMTSLSDQEIRSLMGHEAGIASGDAYAESKMVEIMRKMDQRMIDPELHGGWNTVADLTTDISITNVCRHRILLPDSILAHGAQVQLFVESVTPGDDILISLSDNVPNDCISIKNQWHLDHQETGIANRSYLHWELPPK